jgi:hypothetical protein
VVLDSLEYKYSRKWEWNVTSKGLFEWIMWGGCFLHIFTSPYLLNSCNVNLKSKCPWQPWVPPSIPSYDQNDMSRFFHSAPLFANDSSWLEIGDLYASFLCPLLAKPLTWILKRSLKVHQVDFISLLMIFLLFYI